MSTQWSDSKLVQLNQNKTKAILFNFTCNYQLSIQETLLEITNEPKLLRTMITSDLTWWGNTNYITRKAYYKLEIVRRLCLFNISAHDLVLIYTLYDCSMLYFNITKATESKTMDKTSKNLKNAD